MGAGPGTILLGRLAQAPPPRPAAAARHPSSPTHYGPGREGSGRCAPLHPAPPASRGLSCVQIWSASCQHRPPGLFQPTPSKPALHPKKSAPQGATPHGWPRTGWPRTGWPGTRTKPELSRRGQSVSSLPGLILQQQRSGHEDPTVPGPPPAAGAPRSALST